MKNHSKNFDKDKQGSVFLPPSLSLQMPAEEVLKTSLVPPSGALLEWLAMLEEENIE